MPGIASPADVQGCAIAAADLFPAQSWQPPPPAPVRRAPEPPQAPPLPFTYLGQISDGGSIMLFLGRQQSTLIVRAGDIIDGSYRVETINPQRAVLTYLPLDIRQSLTLRNRP
jgi:hypothetical protein